MESKKRLKNQGILNLLTSLPDVGQWKSLSDEQILEAMGGEDYNGRRALVGQLREVMGSFQPTSEAMALLLCTSAQHIQMLKGVLRDIEKTLEKLTAENAVVQELCAMKGIATNTAAKMTAEIVDIRRFAREDSLACYTGLGMREHSTGQKKDMVESMVYNHRVKDAFMTAAKNVVRYNPDSHLAGYYRNLVKGGMSPLEATKRVARALVRVIYRKLSALTVQSDQERGRKQHGKRSYPRWTVPHKQHTPSSPDNNIERRTSRVKKGTTLKRSTANRSHRRKILKKIP